MSRDLLALVLVAAIIGEPTMQRGVTGCHHDVHASLSILAHNQSPSLCTVLDSNAFLWVTAQHRANASSLPAALSASFNSSLLPLSPAV